MSLPAIGPWGHKGIHMELKDLNLAIDKFAKVGRTWADQGHKLAVCTLEHLETSHGDIGPVNRLYLAMPAGSKSSALTAWFLAFGAVVANADKETSKEKPFVFAKDKKTDVAGGRAAPWYTFKPEPTPDMEFDVQKALAAVLSKASKVTANGGKIIGGDLLREIEAIAAGEKKSPSTEPKHGEALM
jgi:hypothetical protein